jgi:hypothetical protein
MICRDDGARGVKEVRWSGKRNNSRGDMEGVGPWNSFPWLQFRMGARRPGFGSQQGQRLLPSPPYPDLSGGPPDLSCNALFPVVK